ncbi:hypothetical protein LINGRAHAP2_LOCUS11341 [Linum grandiflorum]
MRRIPVKMVEECQVSEKSGDDGGRFIGASRSGGRESREIDLVRRSAVNGDRILDIWWTAKPRDRTSTAFGP